MGGHERSRVANDYSDSTGWSWKAQYAKHSGRLSCDFGGFKIIFLNLRTSGKFKRGYVSFT